MSGTDDWYHDLHEKKCKSKRRFHSAQKAKAAAWHEGNRRNMTLFYYRCPSCSKWHLTKSDPKDHALLMFKSNLWKAVGAGLISREEYGEAVRQFELQQKKGGGAM